MKLFLPNARATNWLLIVGFCSIGYALYMRYLAVEQSSVGLACQAGLNTWLCFTRQITIVLFTYSVFGWVALIVAALNLLRPSLVLFALALAATAVACKEQPRRNADGTPALSYAGQDSLLKQKDSLIAEKTRQLSEQSAIIGDAATSARLISEIDKDLANVRVKAKKAAVTNVAETEANASSKLETIQSKVRFLLSR